MKIRLAKRIGFCFGVKRAVEMADSAISNKRPIYSLGAIIHNKQVVDALSKRGLKVVRDIGKIKKGYCVISSHGISPRVVSRIKKRGIGIIDTTCPFVLKAQKIARSMSGASYNVLIVGESAHPEVKALVDFVAKAVFVIGNEAEARRLRLNRNEKYIIISQTTQSTDNFERVVRAISRKNLKELRVFNTICKDAQTRQGDARRLAGGPDLMLVVGGSDSANTKRLLEVCKAVLRNSHLVETEKDLKNEWFKGARSIGVTSGASTPEWVVGRVAAKVKTKVKAKKSKIKR